MKILLNNIQSVFQHLIHQGKLSGRAIILAYTSRARNE